MADAQSTAEKTPAANELPKPRRSLWRWIPLVILIGGSATVWFLPEIIAGTSMKQYVINSALTDMKGTAQVETIEIGWLKPVRLVGVSLKDEARQEVITIEQVDTQHSLWELIIRPTEIGIISLQSPVVSLTLTEQGSNLQEMFSAYAQESEPSDMTYAWGLDVKDGRVDVQDEVNAQQYRVNQLNVFVSQKKTDPLPEVNSTFEIQRAESKGSFECVVDPNGDAPNAKLIANDVPLDVFSPLLELSMPGLHVHSVVSVNLDSQWTKADFSDVSVAGTFEARDLDVSGEEWLGANRIDADRISGTVACALAESAEDNSSPLPKVSSNITIQRGQDAATFNCNVESAGETSVAKIQTEGLPTSFLGPVIEYLAPGMKVVGTTSATIDARWNSQKPEDGVAVTSSLTGDSVILSGDDWFGPRRIGSKTSTAEIETLITNDFQTVASTGTVSASPLVVVQRDTTSETGQETVVWSDPEVTTKYDVVFDVAKDALTLNPTTVTGKTVGVSAQGAITDFSVRQVVDISGNVQYDVQNLLSSALGADNQTVQIVGLRTKEFFARGPLWPPMKDDGTYDMQAASAVTGLSKEFASSMTIDWKQAQVYGLEITPGLIEAHLSDSDFSVKTHGVKVGDGKISIAPSVNIAGENPVISHEKGVLLDKIALNDELSRQWLKFASPLFADATAVKGSFSFALNEPVKIDTGDISKASSKSSLLFHQAQLSPGPMIQRIDGLIGTIRTVAGKSGGLAFLQQDAKWVNIPRQVVTMTMKDGRMYHDKIVYVIGGAEVHSSGSVGMVDQTVDVVLQMPIPEKWVEGKPFLANLQGEAVTIGIGGSLDRPQVNGRAITDLARKFGAGTAGNLIFDLIDKRRKKNR